MIVERKRENDDESEIEKMSETCITKHNDWKNKKGSCVFSLLRALFALCRVYAFPRIAGEIQFKLFALAYMNEA